MVRPPARWRDRGGLVWLGLARLGLSKERWESFAPWQQRLAKIIVAGIVLLAVLAPIYGFRASAYIGFLILALLYVPDWGDYRFGRFRLGRFVVPLAVLALAAAYPYYVDHLFKPSVFEAFPALPDAFLVLIYVSMALGLNIVVGYAGLLDIGYVAFYAIGAYTAAWLASPNAARYNWNLELGGVGVPVGVGGIHFSIWLVLPIAALLAAFVGVVIGLPTLRLRGDYLAIVTLGFGEITYVTATNGDSIAGKNITNGPQGINPIDPPGFGSWLHDKLGLPSDFLSASNADSLYYWTALAVVVFVVLCSVRLRDSKLGRAWVAIREDETAAAAMGVPLMRTKTWAYAIGAFMGGIAGALWASQQGLAVPTQFLFSFSIFVLCMVILGGMGSIWGVILGGTFLAYLNQDGIANVSSWYNSTFSANADLTKYSYGIYGLILVLVMLFRPVGLVPSARRKAEFELGVEDTPLVDVRGAAAE